LTAREFSQRATKGRQTRAARAGLPRISRGRMPLLGADPQAAPAAASRRFAGRDAWPADQWGRGPAARSDRPATPRARRATSATAPRDRPGRSSAVPATAPEPS
jgi:hypothetical protein